MTTGPPQDPTTIENAGFDDKLLLSHDRRWNVSMHNTDARSAGEMPAGNMADFNGQPGLTIDEMSSGTMTSEASITSTGMYEGRPGVEGEMPSSPSASTADVKSEMPTGAMSEGRPGVDGDMPDGAMGVTPKMGAEAASTPSVEEQPTLEVTGQWRLTFWVSDITRK